eukprot:GHRQ01036381.1.p1 GENE.GHRQ01036381.1~~GHRQ01036381.1.p1  ORF type:complete len:156 (-),score=50.27 GHRQ01036381.1:152-619(-)
MQRAQPAAATQVLPGLLLLPSLLQGCHCLPAAAHHALVGQRQVGFCDTVADSCGDGLLNLRPNALDALYLSASPGAAAAATLGPGLTRASRGRAVACPHSRGWCCRPAAEHSPAVVVCSCQVLGLQPLLLPLQAALHVSRHLAVYLTRLLLGRCS